MCRRQKTKTRTYASCLALLDILLYTWCWLAKNFGCNEPPLFTSHYCQTTAAAGYWLTLITWKNTLPSATLFSPRRALTTLHACLTGPANTTQLSASVPRALFIQSDKTNYSRIASVLLTWSSKFTQEIEWKAHPHEMKSIKHEVNRYFFKLGWEDSFPLGGLSIVLTMSSYTQHGKTFLHVNYLHS